MQTILVPVDFSKVSEGVVSEAAKLARGKASRIVVLHVVPPPQGAGYPQPIVLDMGPLVAAMMKSGMVRLMRMKASMKKRGITCRILQVEGIPVVEIVECAKMIKADYIVIGSHGHSGFYDLLVGSTTSGVLKRTPCPVVVVPPKKGGRRR